MLYRHPEPDLHPGKKNSFLTGRNLEARMGGASLLMAVQVMEGKKEKQDWKCTKSGNLITDC